jgi:hypothetical protein
MDRRLFLLGTGSLAVGAAGSPVRVLGQAASPVRHGRGSLASTADYAGGAPTADPDLLAGTLHRPHANLPASYIVANLPPVYDQGEIASCEAHAFGYGLGGYTASLLPKNAGHRFDISLAQNQPSRAWLFKRQIVADKRGSCANGTYCFGYLEQLAALGAPSEAQVPYPSNPPQDCDWFSAVDALDLKGFSNATQFLIGSYRAFPIDPKAQPMLLQHMKRYLHNDHVLAFSGSVGSDYESPALSSGVYYPRTPSSAGSHGQMVVGYDDTIGDAALGKGAFLVQNSWGLDWPAPKSERPGYLWWSYDAWFAFAHGVSFAFPPLAGAPAGEPLQADNPQAPQATISSVHATAQGLLLTHEFAAPVRMQRISIVTPRKAHWVTTDGTTIVNGYSYFVGPHRFAAGQKFDVEIDALWQQQQVIYKGTVQAA